MFFDQYEYAVGSKGRVKVPPAFTDELTSSFKATRGPNGVIWLLPPSLWNTVERMFGEKTLPFQGHAAKIYGLIFGNTSEVTLDRQGRIMLTPVMRRHCDITGTAVFRGAGLWVELWSPDRLEEYRADEHDLTMDELFREHAAGK